MVTLYDTTLRDGEQTPGVAFGLPVRKQIVAGLDALGVRQVEIGFAASGPSHRADMAALVEMAPRTQLLSLARPSRGDIDDALAVGVGGVLLFISTSDVHLQHKLRMDFEEVLPLVSESIAYARSQGLWVQMTAEDAIRTPTDRVRRFAAVAAEAGVLRIGLADTVGRGTPERVAELVEAVSTETGTDVAVHCHDDMGLATANTLAGLQAGAVAASVTVNGIGERAGNASLEECAVALEELYGVDTGLDLSQLGSLSALVARASGIAVPPNKAVVGDNCFRHESGIHIAAILREPACYEPMDPAKVGATRTLQLGKTSGRAAVRHLVGEDLDDATCARLLERIKVACEDQQILTPEAIARMLAECRL